MKARISSYGLIGDMHTAGLLSRNGSLAWLCWPGFDSEACFASLLPALRPTAFGLLPLALFIVPIKSICKGH